jgi:hypothetical protein
LCSSQISLGRSNQGEWGGRDVWYAWVRRRKFWWKSPKKRVYSEDRGVDGRMGSEWILGRLEHGWVDSVGPG